MAGTRLVHKVLWGGYEAKGPINAADMFWLPPQTPFGNLQLKLFKLRERVAHINRRIDDAWKEWHLVSSGRAWDVNHEPLVVEEIMYSIRRTTDELLGLRWLLAEWDRTGAFPKQIRVDSIDSATKLDDPLIRRHRPFLDICNSASNAYKHSFLQTDLSLIGDGEPCVFALRLPRNDLNLDAEEYSATLNDFVAFFTSFLEDSLADLRAYGARLQAAEG